MKKTALLSCLLALSCAANANPNLVVNGNFETGTFAGWTKSGNTSLSDVIANTVTSNHTYVWRSGATGSEAYISQILGTTAHGTYTLSFDVFNTATSNAIFEADFGGVQVAGFVNEVHNWTHYDITNLVATSDATLLKFGARNDPSFVRLDNVSVVQTGNAVPEPASAALMLAAAVGLLAARQRRA